MKLAMYVCTLCDVGIAASVADPVVWTSKGKFHRDCATRFYARLAESEDERRARLHRERSVRALQRDMTPMSLVTFK